MLIPILISRNAHLILIKTSGGSQYYTVLCSTNRHPRLGAPPAQGARRPDAGGARGQARRRAEQRRALGAQRASERGVDGLRCAHLGAQTRESDYRRRKGFLKMSTQTAATKQTPLVSSNTFNKNSSPRVK